MKQIGLSVLVLASAVTAPACDLCNIYSALEASGESGKGLHASVAEQFTRFHTLQFDGVEVPNVVSQTLESSITQLVLGYNFSDIYGVQLNLPVIRRRFLRPDGLDLQRGTVTGLGDLSLIAHARIANVETKNFTFRWHILGGVKFPTGSTSRLKEEVDELTAPPPPAGAEESGIHGHDLTLGSGSVDGVLGTSAFARWKRVFINGTFQYSIRSEGDYDYKFANDLMWSGGPGVFVVLGDKFTCSLQAVVSGELKQQDRFMSMPAEDTAVTSVFLGPQVNFSWGERLSAELGADFPVSIGNTSLQLVPTWRLRGGLTWRF